MILFNLQKILRKLPDFKGSNWLIRFPLSIIFLQQGFSKIPIDSSMAETYSLPLFLWYLVILGELTAGIGIIFGGILKSLGLVPFFGDFLTRFSGIIIVSIICGVIIISNPDSMIEILFYDHIHVMLFSGGLYFALRGNRAI